MELDDAPSRQTKSEYPVGLVATSTNLGQLAPTVANLTESSHEVLVTYEPYLNPECLRFAQQLGAHIVRPEHGDVETAKLHRRLEEAARTRDSPGIIFGDPGDEVDVERCAKALRTSTSYSIAADSFPAAPETPPTLAAIPAYNESETIGDVVATTSKFVDEVVVVDDGSTDGTVEAARNAGATVVVHETNRGYGASLNTIFREADERGADKVVILDADGQHDPEDIPRLIEAQAETGSELVVGSRFTDGGACNAPLYRRFGLWVINLLTNLSLGVVRTKSWVSDTQSGFRLYDRRAIATLATDRSVGDGMNASTDILYHAHHHDYQIAEVGVTVDYDVENASSHNPLRHGLSLVTNILKTVERERPLTALGVPGFVGTVVGLGFGYWTLVAYFESRSFPVGLAIAAILFVLAGIFSSFTAIILHAVSTLGEARLTERT